ncbi:endonuclease/exonuclease/phosphatase family protein [Prochlorococcus sp. AH-716-E13]|nr:endonuclease/exonuclease/phosphatase family protein [Prochlorococcus sp. AH-716-E13]
MLNISCWNSDWATHKSKRGKFFIDQFDSDIICLTEGYENLLPQDGYIISSNEDYGYKTKKGRKKVILWSKNKWTTVNQIGSKEIPTGRFISGFTNGIRIIGICIPWRFAHVSTGRKDRKPWEDHLSFIQNLSFSNQKTIILGDFNQNIPKKNQPEIVFSSLKNMIDGFKLLTTNMGLIHIVISTDLDAENIQRIATENNSDHDGINCSIKFA